MPKASGSAQPKTSWLQKTRTAIQRMTVTVLLIPLAFGLWSLYDAWKLNEEGHSGNLLAYKPDEASDDPLEQLQAMNPDVIGWISVEDTNIDHPLVQSRVSDMEYVHKNAKGEYSLCGAIFLSTENSPDLRDPYSLIYGHHMENGGMFGDLHSFMDEQFLKEHSHGSILANGKQYDLTIFAAMKTDAYDAAVYDLANYRQSNEALMEYLEDNAQVFNKALIKDTEQIVCLSTCYDMNTQGRIVVFGTLSETI